MSKLLGWCCLLTALLLPGLACASAPFLPEQWPEVSMSSIRAEDVRFASKSPFSIADDPSQAPAIEAQATLYMPPDAKPGDARPAAILLHGASGVLGARGPTYARQLAQMGVAALVIDVFGPRRDMGRGFTERVLNITETMFLADAHAGLDFLATRPEIDATKVVLIGYSYGAMASLYAAQERVADLLGNTRRFIAHVAYYAPCIVDFDPPQTTGAPVLMMMGDHDALVDVERCREVAQSMREGGSDVEMIVYPGAYHQWDGWSTAVRRLPRGLAGCHLKVGADGIPQDTATGLAMTSSWRRTIILGLCTDKDGFEVKRDDAVRARSNAALSEFLNRVWTTS